MSSKLLNSEYDPQVYNLMPELAAAVSIFVKKEAIKAVDRLGQIFMKHNAFENFALQMVHRHFDMSNEEILVETLSEDQSSSVAIPWTFSEGKLVHSPVGKEAEFFNSYDFNNKKFILPHTFAIDKRNPGSLKPFEFLATNEFHNTIPSSEFVQDLYEELKLLNLENVFGLRYVWRQIYSYETTDGNSRANVVKFGAPPPSEMKDDFVNVLFRIGKDGRRTQGSSLCLFHIGSSCHHCSGHCRHSK